MPYMQGVNSDGEPLRGHCVSIDSEIRHLTDICCQSADDGMTRQEFADECDINVLMSRYEKTGVITHYNRASPAYLDLADLPDLQEALAIVDAAQVAFMTLPAKVRREFDNDPVKFADYASDPGNLDRMREWGLAPPAPAPEAPIKVEVTNPSSDQSAA